MPFFLIPLSIGLSLLHVYAWKRLIKDTMSPGPRRRIATGGLIVLDLLLVSALLLGWFVPQSIARWFAWPGFVWFGLFFYLMLTVLALEIPRLALLPWVRRDPRDRARRRKPARTEPDDVPKEQPSGVTRRVLLARGSAAVAGVTATAMVGYGMPVALGPPQVKDRKSVV